MQKIIKINNYLSKLTTNNYYYNIIITLIISITVMTTSIRFVSLIYINNKINYYVTVFLKSI